MKMIVSRQDIKWVLRKKTFDKPVVETEGRGNPILN
jgi:hypothetical protein